MDGFKIVKGVHQGCILSPYLFNFYAEYITQNARLDEAQAGNKIARKILTYEDDITLIAESKEELKSLLMKVKKLTYNSTFRKLRSCHPVPSLDGE